MIRDGDTIATGGLKVAINQGRVNIEQEGRAIKFLDQVEHVTFSGKYAQMKKKPVLYITE